MIFEARDRGTPALTSYQRVIITVRPANEVLRWRQAMTQDKEWYSSKEAIRIADNVLFFQHENGGWSKNIEWAAKFNRDDIADALQYSESVGTTIDNGATHTQMTYLAKVYEGTGRDNYRDAFLRGLDFLLEAQYRNGGWPQYYPLREGYYSHITFNDGAMIEVMRFLRDVTKGDKPYAFVDSVRRKKVEKAVEKGLKIILKTQLKDSDGSLSGWCAQYDKTSLKPAKARSYELPSICGSETGGIVDFLMGIENPGREVVRAVEGAMAWLDRVTIRGIRLERKDDPSLHKGFDLIVVNDPEASPLWARFYEIGTNRPIFVGRDGKVKYSLAEIEQERRVGYRYYVTYPERLLKSTYPEWRKRLIEGQ